MSQQSREKFEAWAIEQHARLDKDERFDFPVYKDVLTHERWVVWQAAIEEGRRMGLETMTLRCDCGQEWLIEGRAIGKRVK